MIILLCAVSKPLTDALALYRVIGLLDYLDGALWALCFACSAYEAFVKFDCHRFGFLDFVNADWASVYAGFASIAFGIVNHYFYHLYLPLDEFYQKQKGKIKAFRLTNGFLHVVLARVREW